MSQQRNLWRTLPGIAISVFCLWWTFRGFHLGDFSNVRLVAPLWLAGVVAFTILGYGTRCYRWFKMLRSVNASFGDCARVLLTSLAANNILPFRIGDVMRIFTYAEDLHTTPSVVMSTVLLEKLLDVFSLAVLMALSLTLGGAGVGSPHLLLLTEISVVVSTVGLLVMVFGANMLEPLVKKFTANTKRPLLLKLEHWVVMALDCMRQIGVAGTLMLIVTSLVAWGFEVLMYVSATKAIGLETDPLGPMQATAEANLSFLVPSSPGGIGPFELACKDALLRHGVTGTAATLFGLVIHLWLLVSLTSVGGVCFLVHRQRRAARLSMLQEIEILPAELPQE
jgi:uncharacterized protein (TIRG00374 family)